MQHIRPAPTVASTERQKGRIVYERQPATRREQYVGVVLAVALAPATGAVAPEGLVVVFVQALRIKAIEKESLQRIEEEEGKNNNNNKKIIIIINSNNNKKNNNNK